MELHPIIPVSIDDTISLKRNTTVFSLAAGTVIITYTTIVWSVKLQQHPKTVFVVIRVLRGILEQNIFAQFSLHKIIPPFLENTPPLPLQIPMPASYNTTKPHTGGFKHTSSQKQLCVSFIQTRQPLQPIFSFSFFLSLQVVKSTKVIQGQSQSCVKR